nr:unnamed protein product [Digitaria exilis]
MLPSWPRISSAATSAVLATTQCVEPSWMCMRGPTRVASSWKVRCTGGRRRWRWPITGRLVGPGGRRDRSRHEETRWRRAMAVAAATTRAAKMDIGLVLLVRDDSTMMPTGWSLDYADA